MIPEREDEDAGLSTLRFSGRIFLGVEEIAAEEFLELRAGLPEEGYPEILRLRLRLPGERDRVEV